jgi:hypothetical protein
VKSKIAAIMSDAVNRKSMRMDIGALYDFMKDGFDVGMPQLVSHDRHRPVGWVVPAAVYLEPGLTRVLAHVIESETDEDFTQIKKRWKKYIASTIHGVPQQSITRLKELLGPDVLTGSEIPWDSGAHALRGAGLAQRAFPEIFEQADKDGLVPFTALTMIRPGIFQIGELCVFAHHFMRRSEIRATWALASARSLCCTPGPRTWDIIRTCTASFPPADWRSSVPAGLRQGVTSSCQCVCSGDSFSGRSGAERLYQRTGPGGGWRLDHGWKLAEPEDAKAVRITPLKRE